MVFLALSTQVLFGSLERGAAIAAVNVIIPKYYLYSYGLGAVLLVTGLLRARGQRQGSAVPQARLKLYLTGLMVGVTLIGGLVLLPKAQALMSQVPSFDPEVTSPARQAFGRIHGISQMLNLVAMISGLVLMVLTAATEMVREYRRRIML